MRLSGIARGPQPTLLERTSVTTESGPLGKIEKLEPFELELEGGHRVHVELAQHLRLEPVEKRDTEWGELEADPSFASLREKAPGPHIPVHVSRALLQEGMRVELLAEDDAEHIFSAGGSHRDAPERKLARVTARAIATGENAAEVLERMLAPGPKAKPARKKRAPKSSSKLKPALSPGPLVVGLLSLPFFYAASAIKLTPLTVDLAVIGATFLSAALTSWALSRVPRFVSDGRVIGRLGDVAPGRIVLFTFTFPAMMSSFVIMEDYAGPWQPANTPPDLVYNGSWASLILLAGWSLGLVYLAFTRGQREARLFRVLLGAPALPSEGALNRTWGSFEGVVRDPTPVTAEGEAMAIVHVISEEVQSGSDPNIYTERVLSKGTFFVDATDDRGSLEIQPDGAVWSSSVALEIPKKGSGGKIIEHLRAVPLRGNVLVAGRVDRKAHSKLGHVASGGHESLLFVAVRQGESARAECHAMIFLRRVAMAIALATLAAAIGGMVVVEPQLPKFNLRPSGD